MNPVTNLKALDVLGLLKQYASILDELRHRKVSNTSNSPIGDYGEWLVRNAFGGSIQPNSNKAVDVVTSEGVRLQVKTRWLRRSGDSRQLSLIRNLDKGMFDAVAAVLLGSEFEVEKACLIPLEVVRTHSKWIEHTHGHRLVLGPAVCNSMGVKDITAEVRKAASEILSS